MSTMDLGRASYPVFFEDRDSVIKRLLRRSSTWNGRKCPECEFTMEQWFADVRIPILGEEGPPVTLYASSVPVVKCDCPRLHLFENDDKTDTDLIVIREMFEAQRGRTFSFGDPELLNSRRN